MKLETRAVFGWGPTAAGKAPCKNGLVVHFDGFDQGLAHADHDECRATWKFYRKFHMGSTAGHGWLDIGYSYGVCPHGIVLEGRGWGRAQAAQPKGNTTWTSVTFMSGPREKPTAAQMAAFAELRAWLQGKGLAAAVRGHRDFSSTDCPGTILYDLVKSGAFTDLTVPRILRVVDPPMKGDDVREVQKALNAAGAKPKLRVDGAYGALTGSAVKAYKKAHGLKADTVFGAAARDKLLG